jgi:hypothetical protein
MDAKTFDEHVRYMFDKCEDTMRSKGKDYSDDTDRLSNFKRGAELTGAPPLTIALIYAAKHWDAIATYIREDANGVEQKPSEPITMRLVDLINYLVFIGALIEEKTIETYQEKTRERIARTNETIMKKKEEDKSDKRSTR